MATRRRGRLPAALALGLVLTVPACAAPVELAPSSARTIQQDVLTLTEAVAEQRLDDAATQLEQTRSDLEAAAGAGDVSAARYAEIDDALDRVAAELEALRAASAAERVVADEATPAAADPDETAAADPDGEGEGDAPPEPPASDGGEDAPAGPSSPGKGAAKDKGAKAKPPGKGPSDG